MSCKPKGRLSLDGGWPRPRSDQKSDPIVPCLDNPLKADLIRHVTYRFGTRPKKPDLRNSSILLLLLGVKKSIVKAGIVGSLDQVENHLKSYKTIKSLLQYITLSMKFT